MTAGGQSRKNAFNSRADILSPKHCIPKETWRRTVEKEVKRRGFSLNETPKVAADRARWRDLLKPHGPRGPEED
ncbi:unnamed protein product [Merluccius merluccius]